MWLCAFVCVCVCAPIYAFICVWHLPAFMSTYVHVCMPACMAVCVCNCEGKSVCVFVEANLNTVQPGVKWNSLVNMLQYHIVVPCSPLCIPSYQSAPEAQASLSYVLRLCYDSKVGGTLSSLGSEMRLTNQGHYRVNWVCSRQEAIHTNAPEAPYLPLTVTSLQTLL